MVIIESIRIIIRPLTLRVRLLANMLAGHLLLRLVGSALRLSMVGGVVLLAQTRLVVLELAVAFLQRVVFITLITLYSKE
jgi:F-type H+-transporting ATPase subunit a